MSTDEVIASDEPPQYLLWGTRNLPVTHIHLYICLFFSCALMRRVFLSRFVTTFSFLPLQLDDQLLFFFKTPLSSLFFHVLHAASQQNVLFLRFLDASSHLYMRVCPSVRPCVRPLAFKQNRQKRRFQPARRIVLSTQACSFAFSHLFKGVSVRFSVFLSVCPKKLLYKVREHSFGINKRKIYCFLPMYIFV